MPLLEQQEGHGQPSDEQEGAGLVHWRIFRNGAKRQDGNFTVFGALAPFSNAGRRGGREQAVEAGIEFGVGLARVIVEHDPQRAWLLRQRRQR